MRVGAAVGGGWDWIETFCAAEREEQLIGEPQGQARRGLDLLGQRG